MKVLVTGGYGFIGSHVAEKFFKEGYEVFVIDNLSSGDKSNLGCKHTFYRFNVEDDRCREVFKSNNFDLVIHLAAQTLVKTSVENPSLDAKSNILGLVNMLNLAKNYGVKKFIFISSAAVYGDNGKLPLSEDEESAPLSPYGMSKHLGEYYCKKWRDLYCLDTLCLRLSNVYGPRSGTFGEGGVIANFLTQVYKESDLTVYGDGEQSRDFVYVGDIAEAICRAAGPTSSYVLNLATNTQSSVNDLIAAIKNFATVKDVKHLKAQEGDIKHSRLDNSRAIKELDWVPKYSLEEGIKKTAEWYACNIDTTTASKEKLLEPSSANKKSSHLVGVLFPYIENIILSVAAYGLSALSQSHPLAISVDFRLLYIVLIGIIHGLRQSTLAVFLSTAAYIIELLRAGKDIATVVYDLKSLLQISTYFLVGIGLGYVIDKKNIIMEAKQEELHKTEDELTFFKAFYEENLKIKEALEEQIKSSKDSFVKIYNITSQLDSFEPEKIFDAAISVVEHVMETSDAALYIVAGSGYFLRLSAKSGKSNLVMKSMRLADTPGLERVVRQKEIFVNYELKDDLPVMAAPIIDNDNVVALMLLNKVDFSNLSLYYQNLFKITVGLINSALIRAFRYEQAIYHEKYVQDTIILKPESFDRILASKTAARQKEHSEFCILCIEQTSDLMELSNNLNRTLRETDYVGLDRGGKKIYLILSNTSVSEALVVVERLKKIGIQARLLEESHIRDFIA